ncbi:hypothetical protein FI667_g7621, partial [Globisporangium splendens]
MVDLVDDDALYPYSPHKRVSKDTASQANVCWPRARGEGGAHGNPEAAPPTVWRRRRDPSGAKGNISEWKSVMVKSLRETLTK